MSTKSSQRTFIVPERTEAQWEAARAGADAFDARERRRRDEARLRRVCIPAAYASADLSECDPAVAAWASDPSCDLVIEGRVGRGKTHAACAALLALWRTRRCLFERFADVLLDVKAAYDGQGTERGVIGRLANVDVLCLDDFGKERPTEWAVHVIWDVVDRRRNAGRPTVYTTQYEGPEIARRLGADGERETALAIVSRMAGARRITLDGPDRRLA